ncbi:MAG: hypothetical protein MZV70_29410 [Desulfobacterales bacterium]|nr:hypothetical protein [Desulfobacterales bacterium]
MNRAAWPAILAAARAEPVRGLHHLPRSRRRRGAGAATPRRPAGRGGTGGAAPVRSRAGPSSAKRGR